MCSFRQGLDRQLPVTVPEEKNMPLINLVIALIVVGMLLWLVNRYIPMAASIKTILNVVVVVAVCVWVLQATGLWGPLSSYRVSR
jgi:predicted membrane protein